MARIPIRQTVLMLLLALIVGIPVGVFGQDLPPYQTDFPIAELDARRNAVFEQIGSQAVAIIQGAPDVRGFEVFRQTNTFYYLTGLETPHAYLFLDGRSKTSKLYLPHQNPGRERGEGRSWSAEDAALVQSLTGVTEVHPVEDLARHWTHGGLVRPPFPTVYTPFSPPETGTDSRDELYRYRASRAADPWDGQPERQEYFIATLKARYPGLELADLSPIMDGLRSIKSAREIELIRRSSMAAGLGLVEAMRCTEPGVFEYQLEACARFVHAINGSRRPSYGAIIGGGTNAFMGHYFRNDDPLHDGDLVLMDYSPEIDYYSSDVTRMWPVNGTFSKEQAALYGFVVEYQQALFRQIRPGVLVSEVLEGAALEMADYIDQHDFFKPAYLTAVEKALTFRGHMQHPVGMAVHDVGNYKAGPLKVGQVFAVDPMIWIPEEKLYIRIEDVGVVTADGFENFTDSIPATVDEIEMAMREPGLFQLRPDIKIR